MKTIRISKQVYEEIAKRGKFGETPNDVLERVFEIRGELTPARVNRRCFLPPDGTECRFNHHGKYVYGRIQNGQIIIPDVGVYSSFSTPACELTGTSMNGWLYWEIRLPGENGEWMSANKWRSAHRSQGTRENPARNRQVPWADATLQAIQRYCRKHNTRTFTLQELIKEELGTMIEDTRTRGKTPINTLQYYLQKLRDSGHVAFIDNQGSYRLA